MNKTFRKILPSLIFAAVIVIGGVFFDGMSASAKNGVQMNMPMMLDAHCNVENQGIQKTSPVNNSFMPCCIERHDNSGTIIPSEISSRVKFSQVMMTQQVDYASRAIEQKIYPSSPSPPPAAENISSTVKIE